MAKAVAKRTVLDDETVVLDLHGELDIAVNDALRDILIDTITNERPPRIVVNMRRVAFIDSTGISALIAGYNAAKQAGIEYEVNDLAPFIRQQLRAVGVLGLIAPGLEQHHKGAAAVVDFPAVNAGPKTVGVSRSDNWGSNTK